MAMKYTSYGNIRLSGSKIGRSGGGGGGAWMGLEGGWVGRWALKSRDTHTGQVWRANVVDHG
jgi:hypothetical protein